MSSQFKTGGKTGAEKRRKILPPKPRYAFQARMPATPEIYAAILIIRVGKSFVQRCKRARIGRTGPVGRPLDEALAWREGRQRCDDLWSVGYRYSFRGGRRARLVARYGDEDAAWRGARRRSARHRHDERIDD